jgi:hypothetical protein
MALRAFSSAAWSKLSPVLLLTAACSTGQSSTMTTSTTNFANDPSAVVAEATFAAG